MAHHTRLHRLSDCTVFFDFDNTMTPFDVLDDIIRHFSINKKWMKFERLWKAGKMGSKECLQNQLKSVRVEKSILLRYLSTIKLDPHIHKLIAMLERNGIKPVIVSDSFLPLIEAILKTNGIKGAKVCSNHLRFYKNHLVPLFPHKNGRCFICAHCKKKNLRKHNMEDKIIIYIGDGLSDICPAQYADIVFAKGRLLNYFRKKKMLCIAFKDFEDIYDYLRRLER